MSISFCESVIVNEVLLLHAYRCAYGSDRLAWSKGRRPLAWFLHSSRAPGELSQCSKYDDSNINIVQQLLLFFKRTVLNSRRYEILISKVYDCNGDHISELAKVARKELHLKKVKKRGKDVDLYSTFHAPGTPNVHTSLELTRQTAI